MRLFIFGSCVSRDALEYQEGEIALVKYVARTSLATQISAPVVFPEILDRLPSRFQREMMSIDMHKTLFALLRSMDFDTFLMDFIDERFSIGIFNGARLNLTREFLDANNGELQFPEWNRFSEEKFFAWRRGFDELMALLCSKECVPKILINKVYFASRSGMTVSSAAPCQSFMSSEIIRNNAYLERMYEYVERNYSNVLFLKYSEQYFTASLNHKWGLAPFHYTDEIYREMLSQLLVYHAP